MKPWHVAVLLTAIVSVGCIVRIYRLGQAPAGFFCDEAATGYNAYQLLKSGKDEFGRPWPIFFESFGIWRAPIPFYATIPAVWVFGLSEFSSRLPSAIIGSLTIIAIFFLAYELTASSLVALASALFLAISPWHIQFSRYAEANAYWPFFLTLSIVVFLRSLRTKNNTLIAIACGLFGLSLYTYFPAYLLSPLFLALLTCVFLPNIWHIKKGLMIGLIVFFVIAFPLLAGIRSGATTARLTMTSSSAKDKTLQTVAKAALVTYRDHFMPDFLFLAGDIGYRSHFITRYSVRGMGQLYLWQFPLILVGLWMAAKKNPKLFKVSILWLLLYPVGSSVVPFADGGGPFATRSIMGVIPFQILCALGLFSIATWIKQKGAQLVFVCICACVMFVSVSWYTHQYFMVYPRYSSDFWGWQYGARETMMYFLAHSRQYDELYLTDAFNSPNSFITFYDPENHCSRKCRIGRFDRLDESKKQLFSVSPKDLEELKAQGVHMNILHVVSYPNTDPAFFIGVLHKTK